MRRATQVTLLTLAALVVFFVAVWLTIPASSGERVSPPASLFIGGISSPGPQYCIDFEGTYPEQVCVRYVPRGSVVDLEALERRVVFGFGGAAAVIVLIGLAFGIGHRDSAKPS